MGAVHLNPSVAHASAAVRRREGRDGVLTHGQFGKAWASIGNANYDD